MPTSGFGFRPWAAVNSMRDAQSSVGIDRKPDEISRTSKLHGGMVRDKTQSTKTINAK